MFDRPIQTCNSRVAYTREYHFMFINPSQAAKTRDSLYGLIWARIVKIPNMEFLVKMGQHRVLTARQYGTVEDKGTPSTMVDTIEERAVEPSEKQIIVFK